MADDKWMRNFQQVTAVKHNGTDTWIRTQEITEWSRVPRTATAGAMVTSSWATNRPLRLKRRPGPKGRVTVLETPGA